MKPETILATLASELDYLKKEEWFIEATKELDVLVVMSAIRQVVGAHLTDTLQELAKSKHKYFDNGGHIRMAFCALMGSQDVGEYVFEKVWTPISNRALNGLPLTPIEDTPDMWERVSYSVATHKRAKDIVFKTDMNEISVVDGTNRYYIHGFGTTWVKQRPKMIPITLPSKIDIVFKDVYYTIEGETLGGKTASIAYLENVFIDLIRRYCINNICYPFDQTNNGLELTTADLTAGVERFFNDFCISVDNFKWKVKSRRELLKEMESHLTNAHFGIYMGELLTALTIYKDVENCDLILKVKGINNKNRIRGICINEDDLMATHAIGNFRKDPKDKWEETNITVRTIKVLNAQ